MMSRPIGLLVLIIMALPGSAFSQSPEFTPGFDYVPLFDGESLDGWSQRNGTATYRVEDNAIVGKTNEGSPNSFLCTEKQYGDFELLFDVKVDSPLNSGVQIRSRSRGDTPEGRVNGPQVEIAAGNDRGSTAGYIYGEAAGGWMTPADERNPHPHFKRGDWNHYRVVALGPRIQVWVNGHQVSDLVHTEKYKTHPKGFIGLQVHGIGAGQGPYEVRWRDLKIRDLGGFEPIYNRQDLSGWTTKGNWRPQEDGSLLIQPGDDQQGWQRYEDYLWTENQYDDFILDLEYTYPPGGNSGVFLRVADRNDPVEQGMEVQILDSSEKDGPMGPHDHGGVIGTQGAAKNMSRPPGEWNHMLIYCHGDHLQVKLNGEDIVDLQLDESPLKKLGSKGYIGLQDHGTPNELRFRNLRIKKLK